MVGVLIVSCTVYNPTRFVNSYEQNFEICAVVVKKTDNVIEVTVPCVLVEAFADVRPAGCAEGQDTRAPLRPGGSVRGERENFTRLVLGCIEAKFCKKICVGKLSPRSSEIYTMHSFAPFCTVLESVLNVLNFLFKNR